ncbi:MAG TPA: DUF222 domain-containing protein [Streptosporangiaceae bacterium]|nr:DUF222 domain-containing protein [Streptosporangiaceae bacterium]
MIESLPGPAQGEAAADPGWDIPGIPRLAALGGGLFTGEEKQPAGRGRRGAAPAGARGGSADEAGWDVPGISREVFRSAGGSAAAAAAGSDASPGRSGGLAAGVHVAVAAGEGWRPDGPAQALAALTGALDYLAHADPAEWDEDVQAGCLRALAAAESRQTAAHARVLAVFSVPGGGLARDGHHSPRMWLSWQTQATRRAASAQVSWMRRLTEHPVLGEALADARLSVSWARQFADWSERLPAETRDGADTELVTAACRGAGLADLARIAEEQRREHAAADGDDDGFEDRAVRIGTTFGGAGRIEGDLTGRCAAAVTAVLDSLSAVRGPEDDRTVVQRQHDALEEACTRLIAAGMLPQRAGQPVRLDLEITLDQLTENTGGLACDALVQPMITGQVDYGLLDTLAQAGHKAELAAAMTGREADARHGLLTGQAIALLSGPSGRAAALRRKIAGGPAVPLSLPLDIPGTFDTIPVHLRRAVRKRDRHCRFPGCDMPPAGCDIHHLIHRKDGGRHALHNLTMLCRFHHLIAIHTWGWTLTLNPDGTTTATSPDGQRVLQSHPPPVQAA